MSTTLSVVDLRVVIADDLTYRIVPRSSRHGTSILPSVTSSVATSDFLKAERSAALNQIFTCRGDVSRQRFIKYILYFARSAAEHITQNIQTDRHYKKVEKNKWTNTVSILEIYGEKAERTKMLKTKTVPDIYCHRVTFQWNSNVCSMSTFKFCMPYITYLNSSVIRYLSWRSYWLKLSSPQVLENPNPRRVASGGVNFVLMWMIFKKIKIQQRLMKP